MFWKILGVIVYLGILIGSIVKVINQIKLLIAIIEPKKLKIIIIVLSIFIIVSLISSYNYDGFLGILLYFFILINIPVFYGIGNWIIEENGGNGVAMILGGALYLAAIGILIFLIIAPFIGFGSIFDI